MAQQALLKMLILQKQDFYQSAIEYQSKAYVTAIKTKRGHCDLFSYRFIHTINKRLTQTPYNVT